MTDSQREEVRIMYENGCNPEDIADELGLDELEVIKYCTEIL